MRGKEIVHDDKVNLATMWQFYSMQSVKSRNEGIGVIKHVLVVLFQYFAQKLVLGMRNRFDDETIVSREIEE